MPELVDTYEELVAAVGGGDLEARFLSHWCPPPLLTACSLAVWDRERHLLVRSYDYPPLLCDTTVLASTWAGTRVVAMTDCVWGAVDGVNEHGLAVAIAFGGRPVVGTGFGIGLVVRYVLQVASDVREALEVLARVPVQLAYNVALTDASGGGAIAMVGPDRPMTVMAGRTAGNRQGATEWPEHAVFCATEEREAALAALVADPTTTPDTLVAGVPGAAAVPGPRDHRVGHGLHRGVRLRRAHARPVLARRRLAAVPGRLRPRHPDPAPRRWRCPPPAYQPAPSADDLLPARQPLLIA